MAETARTIAVLSPEYFRSQYTPSEWANAFRLDPRGEKDLLIPVRVAPVEPESIFAQLTYVDFVEVPESEAVERLLKRIRGERGKPSRPPAFPGAGARRIAAKPPYPAEGEDLQRIIHARELLVRWRDLYAAREQELQEAATKADRWGRAVPAAATAETTHVLRLAVKVARDLDALPLRDLAFARPYGLQVHSAVFDGFAGNQVESHMAVTHVRGPDRYTFENAWRVLEGALQLLRFRLDALPRGFIRTVAPARDLGSHRTFILARIDHEPALQLIAVDSTPEFLGAFAARTLNLHPLCAWKNHDGTIDVVATDSQHVYVWSHSQPHPSAQYAHGRSILAAARDPAARDRVIAVDAQAGIRILTASGEEAVMMPPAEDITDATIWIDPLLSGEWCAVSLTPAFGLRSQHRDGALVRRDDSDLWEPSRDWYESAWLSAGLLDGFPCVVVHRQASFGEGVQFVDPASLRSIRRDLLIEESITSIVLAGGRWLVVFLMRGEHRIAVWDLSSASREPAGRWFAASGEAYEPFVVRESDGAFEVLFILERYSARTTLLCRFRWPEGTVEELATFSNLRILPIESPA